MAMIMCGSSAEEIMEKLQDGRAFNSVYEYLVKLRDDFDMDDGRLCRENVTDYFEIDCPDEYVDFESFAKKRPTEMTQLYRHVILAAWDKFFLEKFDLPKSSADVKETRRVMLNMLQFLEIVRDHYHWLGFRLEDFEYLERYRRGDYEQCIYWFRLLDGRRYHICFFLDPDVDDPGVLFFKLSMYDEDLGRYVIDQCQMIFADDYTWFYQAVQKCPNDCCTAGR